MLIFFLVKKDKEKKTDVRGNIIYPFLQFFRMWRHQYIARHMMAISNSKTGAIYWDVKFCLCTTRHYKTI